MSGFHRNIPQEVINQFADLDAICIVEVGTDESTSRQVEEVAMQVSAWSQEWERRAEFLTRKVVPLGVKVTLVEMTIRRGRRLCRYEAVLRS